MQSKTRALGLSSLVVSSFDKSSEEELEANGWRVPQTLPSFDLLPPEDAVVENLTDSISPILRELTTTKLDTEEEFALSNLILPDFGPFPVRKQARKQMLFFKRRSAHAKRFYLMQGFTLKIAKQEESLRRRDGNAGAYKTVGMGEIDKINLDQTQLACTLLHLDENATAWKLSFQTEQELADFTSNLALRILLHFLLQRDVQRRKTSSDCLALLVQFAQVHLEQSLFPNSTPLLLVSLREPSIALEILKRQVNASCLLRPKVLARVGVQELLEGAKRDLNIIGEQEHGRLTLIHFYILTRRVQELRALLLKIDLPFAHLKTAYGDTPYTLAIKACLPGGKDDGAVLLEMVNALLAFGVSPDERCANGDSAHHLALKLSMDWPALDQVCVALEQYCDINMLDHRGDSPLHIALRSRNLRAAKRMLGDARLDWERVTDQQGNDALLLAMKLHEESFAMALLTKKQPPQRKSKSLPTNAANATEFVLTAARTSDLVPRSRALLPIHLAIKLHQPSLCLLLVDLLTCEEIGLKESTSGRTCLQLAILHSLLGVTFAIINKLGSTPHLLQVQDESTGDDALLLAIRAGRVDVATALLQHLPQQQLQRNAFNGQTCIHACARLVERTYHHPAQSFHTIALFQRLLSRDAAAAASVCQVNACTLTGRKQAVLHWAIRSEDEACGLWLLHALFKHNTLCFEVLDAEGWTPLALAMQLKKWELCKLLIPKSELSREMGSRSDGYLHLLVRAMEDDYAATRVLDMLLAHDVYAGNWNAQGYTALHLACLAPSALALDTLLKNTVICKTRLNDRTELEGRTALLLCLAQESVDFDRVDMLLENGADHRLVEPRTRLGLFERSRALQSAELFEIISQRIGKPLLVPAADGGKTEEEWNTERGRALLQARAREILEMNPLVTSLDAAMEIAKATRTTMRSAVLAEDLSVV